MSDERLGRLLEMLADVMRVAHARGLINVLGGNASFRWGDGFYITPSQVPKHRLSPEDMVYVPFDMEPQKSLTGKKASMEWRMHKYIYQALPEVNAIVHTHNPFTLALYSAGLSVNPEDYIEAYSIGKCVATIPYIPPGSEELAKAVANAVRKCRVVVLLGHGVVAAARTLYQALDAVEALNDICIAEALKHVITSSEKAKMIGREFMQGTGRYRRAAP